MGIPDVLVSDNGSQFVSAEFELFLSSCDVKHVKSSLYYPQSNGLIERFNSSVKQAVRTAVAGGKAPDVAVREMLVAYRSTPQPATGVTPARLMLGRQIRVPANSLISHFLPGKKAVQFADDKDALQAVKDNVERTAGDGSAV
jgi:transposase InsO family protein